MPASKSEHPKVVTLRLSQDEAHRAEFVSRAEGISVNDVFRRALEHYLGALRSDDDFVARAKAQLARENEIANQFV